ncbi:MAG TPA: hypothetical protein VGJ31_17140 [Dongiaceae bacterium]
MHDKENSPDLTGQWQGQYSYSGRRNKSPVPFSATINENGTWLDGVVEEVGTAGDAKGITISASIQGRHTGRAVTWIKIYHGSFRLYDSVQYHGEVAADGQEIEGQWQIRPGVIGRFMMVRNGGKASARRKKVSVEVPSH